MIEIQPFKRRGNLRIVFPKFDILISQFSVDVYFPITYNFENYGGNIEEIKKQFESSFSCFGCLCGNQRLMAYSMSQNGMMGEGYGGEAYRNNGVNQNIYSNVNPMVSQISNIMQDNMDFGGSLGGAGAGTPGDTLKDTSTISGVIPIRVEVPTGKGIKVEFRRLIVKNEHLFITSSYKKKSKTKSESLLNCFLPCV